MRRFAPLLLMVGTLAIGTAPASAQVKAGVRAGVSVDPDQFFVGGHVESQPLADRLTFRPNVELGFGDDFNVVALNLEFAFWPTVTRDRWRLYFGGGPSAVIASGDGRNDDHVGGGFNVLVGGQHSGGLFGELKIGVVDSPELKLTVGYVFR